MSVSHHHPSISYTQNARLASDRYRDQIATPLEIGKHWVKHVAKNGGAPHLRSVAVELPFYALYNLDVWALILAAVLVSVYLAATVSKLLVATVCQSDQRKHKTS